MTRILGKTKEGELLNSLTRETLHNENIAWFWADIDLKQSNKDEFKDLQRALHFDWQSLNDQQGFRRSQLKYAKDNFYLGVFAVEEKNIKGYKVHFFVSQSGIVSVHETELPEINHSWSFCSKDENADKLINPMDILYLTLDDIVDGYFPIIHGLEERIEKIDRKSKNESMKRVFNQVFDIRSDLLKFRHLVAPLEDILHRMIESDHVKIEDHKIEKFHNIYRNLTRLSHMIESDMEITADIRDGYMSLTSYRMNNIMKILTVFSSIFMPLTFIVGLYGMNFKYMPELNWRYGYFFSLIVMAIVGFSMYIWFRKKGWFRD
ncbi:magnesium/cobalt transporter CorA [Terrilactibacillus laevilacticus]|uniref:Magnesium transport protein CorA n=1 Tax=Terrilactibacillus laevilacticus TaxID=1380157 RepID=A0ABW5PP74_9BACI|nr:magnesium/cobalt transporter CorA [Terrilactibacillus laevilacticus]